MPSFNFNFVFAFQNSYVYKNEVTIGSVSSCLLLLKVAIKFELNSLIFECLKYLYEKSSKDNLLDILSCLYELINTGSLCFTGLHGYDQSSSSNTTIPFVFAGQPHSPPPGYSLRPPTPPTQLIVGQSQPPLYSSSPSSHHASQASINSNASTLPIGASGPNSATGSVSNLLAPLTTINPYPERYSPIPGGGRISPYFNGDQSTITQPPVPHQDNIAPQQPANLNGCCNRILNQLFFRCFCKLDEHAEQLLSDARLAVAHHSLLVDILARDTLLVRCELSCFQLLERWCSQQCMRNRRPLLADHKRALAGRAVYLVRYLAMTVDQFFKGPYQSDLLDNDEKDALLTAIQVQERSALESHRDQSPPPSPPAVQPSPATKMSSSTVAALAASLAPTGEHPLPRMLKANGLHLARQYKKPTCQVAPNRVNINANNHPLLDELSSAHDHNNNSNNNAYLSNEHRNGQTHQGMNAILAARYSTGYTGRYQNWE